MTMNDPLAREQAAAIDAKLGVRLQKALAKGATELAFELAMRLIRGDFDDLERHAVPGERELRRTLHEIIDEALRGLILASDSQSDAWRRLVLADEHGLFECNMLSANARWLRLCGSQLVSSGLELLDPEVLRPLDLADQGRALARFCLINDGATKVDYAAFAAALDSRLLPFFHDWLATVHYLSPTRIDDGPAANHQDAAMAALLAARRTAHEALPASSNQSGPAFRAPYFSNENTRSLSIEFNGRQMSTLMQRFKPAPEVCEDLRASTLDTTALETLDNRNCDELIICPNWHPEHVIFRCMSPLVESWRARGAPLLRVFSNDQRQPPVSAEWHANIIDIPHHPELALAHFGAIDRMIATFKADIVFFPEIVPANSSSWMATERVGHVQATGYGFPVTSGLRTIDYFIAGADVERPGAESDYSEQLVLLPGLGVSTTEPPNASRERQRPTNAPLDPADPLRIVATTSHQKFTRKLLETWDTILASNPGAELDLFTNMTPAQVQVHEPVLARLLARGRITLHAAQSRQSIIDTIQEADLYLDAFPYGGFNSLVEPLSLGCPILTIEGQHARNRLGAALARRAGLPEAIIAQSLDESINIANRLLADPGERLALRQALGTRSEILTRLDDPDIANHMDAATKWMRSQGPRRRGANATPILIRAGEKPAQLSA